MGVKEDMCYGERMQEIENPQVLLQDSVKCYVWLLDAMAPEAPEPKLSSCDTTLCCHQLSQGHSILALPLIALGLGPCARVHTSLP